MLGVRIHAPKLIEDGGGTPLIAAGDQDAIPSGGQPNRHRTTDPARAAGHQGRPSAPSLVRTHLKPPTVAAVWQYRQLNCLYRE